MFLWKLFFYLSKQIEGLDCDKSFNPCFYGSYSFIRTVTKKCEGVVSFNPCFYGSYSFTKLRYVAKASYKSVLILVFMEVILLLTWTGKTREGKPVF